MTTPTEQLLVATADLIAEIGWGNVSTRKAATAAGLSPSLVHYHFGSVDELRREAAVAAVDTAVGLLVTTITAVDDASAGIACGLEELATRSDDDRAAALIGEAALAATRDAALRERRAAIWATARRTLASWLSTVAPALDDPEAIAATLVAAIDGAAMHRGIDPDVRVDLVGFGLSRLVTPAPSNR